MVVCLVLKTIVYYVSKSILFSSSYLVLLLGLFKFISDLLKSFLKDLGLFVIIVQFVDAVTQILKYMSLLLNLKS